MTRLDPSSFTETQRSEHSMRTLVLGDIHGGYKALLQCFERSSFDYEKDKLIFLGDAVDGWSQSPQCVEELRKVKNLIYLLGNHDFWVMKWLIFREKPQLWLSQGGKATIKAYESIDNAVKQADHFEFLRHAVFYYHDRQNRLFVHGGIELGVPLDLQEDETFMWDRELFDHVQGVEEYSEIYIGHTPTILAGANQPLNYGNADNIWRVDTGAGWYGKLTIMDVDTKHFWQSDVCQGLYPGEEGRM